MNYPCPRCGFGHLRQVRSTYARLLGGRLVTLPNFPLWRCDSCSYTRYDRIALQQVELLLGAEVGDEDEFGAAYPRMSNDSAEGPAERGPHRWSS